MAPTIEPRRSARLAGKTKTTIDPKTHNRTPIHKKRASPRRAAQKKSNSTPSVDIEQIEEQLATRTKKPQRPRIITTSNQPKRPPPPQIEEPTSKHSEDGTETESEDSEDEFSMEDDSQDSEDEFHEQANLSHDHFEYVNSHDLQNVPGHRYSIQSYDSRLEPGNQVYEEDDFVVNDDEGIVMEHSDDSGDNDESEDDFDLEINMERHPVYASYQPIRRRARPASLFSSPRLRRRSTKVQSPIHSHSPIRTPSHPPRKSIDSRAESPLFYSDLTGDPPLARQLAPWLYAPEEVEVEAPLIAQASAEVVEDISDALVLFSRRVNRDRPHIRLRLAETVLEDEDIQEALEDAIRRGIGRKISLADGSKRWSFGPKNR